MLRHFKMELRRQQELENENKQHVVVQLSSHNQNNQPHDQFVGQQLKAHNQTVARPLIMVVNQAAAEGRPLDMKKQIKQSRQQQQQQPQDKPKRVRGRRSSKPQMEKRRRARINECLDILKSYVLTDTSNLSRLGIDLTASENQDEETIARNILKTSGLINRHRGRKNPNKLEKADILELTVDYVRRLHEQRNELLVAKTPAAQVAPNGQFQMVAHQPTIAHGQELTQQVVPAHLSEPLTLDLSPKSRHTLESRTTPPSLRAYAPPPNTPLTPPSSSNSSSNQNGTSEAEQRQQQQQQHQKLQYHNQMSQMILSRVLNGYQHCDWTAN